jgi:hypothetical protein
MDIKNTGKEIQINSSVGPIDTQVAHYNKAELQDAIVGNLKGEALDLFKHPKSIFDDAPTGFDNAITEALHETIHGDGIVSDNEAREIAEDKVSFDHGKADEQAIKNAGKEALKQVLSGDLKGAKDNASGGFSDYIQSGVEVEKLSTWDKLKTLNPFG